MKTTETQTAFDLISADHEGAALVVIGEEVAAIEYAPSTWFVSITMRSGAHFTAQGTPTSRELVRFVRNRGKPVETQRQAADARPPAPVTSIAKSRSQKPKDADPPSGDS